MIVSDDEVEAALHFLGDIKGDIRTAAYERRLAELRRHSVLAVLIKQSNESSHAARETWARAHEKYFDACESEALAEAEWQTLLARKERAKLTIEVWRSQSANSRSMEQVR